MNQPPQTEKQTGKRIVSKGEFVKAQSLRAGMGFTGFCLHLAAAVSGMLAIPLFLVLVNSILRVPSEMSAWAVLAVSGSVLVLLVIATPKLCKMGTAALDRADKMNNIVPLTRANTADLPAPDTLVRASSEPEQEQQAVLLRATTETQEQEAVLLRAATESLETPAQQLVRAAGKQNTR